MRTNRQLDLPGFKFETPPLEHGGEHAKRKLTRPIDPKQAIHVVLRSSKARGTWSMLHPKHCTHVHDFTHQLARRWGVKIYRYANVGNHIHLLIRTRSRPAFQRFLRDLSGTLAIIITGAKKGHALPRNETNRGFWDHLAFSRIVHFGKDFEGLCRYLIKNLFEAEGIPVKKLLTQGFQLISLQADVVPD